MRIRHPNEECAVAMHIRQYQTPIRSIVETICLERNELARVEYLSYVIQKLTQTYTCTSAGADFYDNIPSDVETIEKLQYHAVNLGECLLGNSDLSSSVNDYTYIFLAIVDGLCGGSHRAYTPSFGFYAGVGGLIENIISKINHKSRRESLLSGALRFSFDEIKKFSQGTGRYYPRRMIEWKELNTDIVVNKPDQEWKKENE